MVQSARLVCATDCCRPTGSTPLKGQPCMPRAVAVLICSGWFAMQGLRQLRLALCAEYGTLSLVVTRVLKPRGRILLQTRTFTTGGGANLAVVAEALQKSNSCVSTLIRFSKAGPLFLDSFATRMSAWPSKHPLAFGTVTYGAAGQV